MDDKMKFKLLKYSTPINKINKLSQIINLPELTNHNIENKTNYKGFTSGEIKFKEDDKNIFLVFKNRKKKIKSTINSYNNLINTTDNIFTSSSILNTNYSTNNLKTFTQTFNQNKKLIHPIKDILYKTGNKYLVKPIDNLYLTNIKIKEKVNKNSISLVKNNLLNKNLLKNNVNNYTSEKLKYEDENFPKLFKPYEEMNQLKRKVELQKEDPYLHINRLIAINTNVDFTPIMMNIFKDNENKFNKLNMKLFKKK